MVKNEKGKKLALWKQTKVESSLPSPPHSRASIGASKKLALWKQTKVESSLLSPPHSRASIGADDSSG
jgi:hypothetical protein